MTGPAPRQRPLSVEEYLAFEEASPVRHEYVAGEIHAMTGATPRHNQIALNIAFHLRAAARGGPCRAYIEAVKLRVGDAIYYPDVMVDCTPAEPALIIESPCLVVEVTSPSTALTDRREKLVAYRGVPTLQAYLLVEQDRRRVTRHWRDAQGAWGYSVITGEEIVPVPCPRTELTLDLIYEDVTMPPLGVAERFEDAVT
ncbi:MAG: Uma2 family endonuclease [Gemmatimonadaceae bacterium]